MCKDSNFIYDFKNCDVADIYELYFEKHGESWVNTMLAKRWEETIGAIDKFTVPLRWLLH